MFEFVSRLERIRDTLKTGAGKAADVLGQVKEAVGAAETSLREVEGGKVFAASPVNEEKLDALATEFHAIAAGPKKTPAAEAGADARLDPGTATLIALIVSELIKLIRERRRKK